MPRAVPSDSARRRRDRLAELIDALGAARGRKVTQREFAGSIGREQGTIAAILGGHRSLGGDVMIAVVTAYRLPGDYFDSPLRPDPRPYARALLRDAPSMLADAPTVPVTAQAIPIMAPAMRPDIAHATVSAPSAPRLIAPPADAALAEVVSSLAPDRAVSMSLEALARKGLHLDVDGWVRLAIGAQSAHDHGVLMDWFDRTLAATRGPR
jgi:transcriptional regulator with XRE-family HTH domain